MNVSTIEPSIQQNGSKPSSRVDEFWVDPHRRKRIIEWIHKFVTQKSVDFSTDPDRRAGFDGLLADLCWANRKDGPEGARRVLREFSACHPQVLVQLARKSEYDHQLPLYHADEIDHLPPLRWLIPNEIPEAGLSVLFGPSGIGKSFLALDYALRIAQEAPVFYIAAEGQTGYSSRKRAWCVYHNQGSGQLHFLFQPVPMLDEEKVDELINILNLIQPTLVVFDTLARCLTGGDENSSRDMGQFVNACSRLQREVHTAVLLIHHTGKSGNSERGSSVLRGACDTMIELKKDRNQISLVSSKTKDAEPFSTRHLKLETVKLDGVQSSCVVVATDSATASSEDGLTQQHRHVLETLNRDTFTEAGATTAVLQHSTRIAESTLYRLLKELKQLEYVTQLGRSKPYFLTETGRSIVTSSV
jgi:hypothetical protein